MNAWPFGVGFTIFTLYQLTTIASAECPQNPTGEKDFRACMAEIAALRTEVEALKKRTSGTPNIISNLALGEISRPLNAGDNPHNFRLNIKDSGLLMANFSLSVKVKEKAASLTISVDGEECGIDRALGPSTSTPLHVGSACFKYLTNGDHTVAVNARIDNIDAPDSATPNRIIGQIYVVGAHLKP